MQTCLTNRPVVAPAAAPARRMLTGPRAVPHVCRAAAAERQEDTIMIRRRPPSGIDQQACGPVDFKVPTDDANKPVNILEEIVWYKAQEIEKFRTATPLYVLQAAAMAAPPARDFRAAIKAKEASTGKPGLIAEVKKASPSKGVIQPDFDAVKIAQAYEKGGAACLSVLTDKKFFQGGFENLTAIRNAGVECPLLCKEFIVEAYQIFKARASGADAILLIAAVLPNSDLEYFMKCAKKLGMTCLIEVHTEQELNRVLKVPGLEEHLLGINNRDLGTFVVELENTKTIMESPAGREVTERGIMMVGESGIFTPEHVAFVQDSGCGAILVGESIVREGDHESAVKTLLSIE